LNYFRVYNRWGQVVFETKSISEGWDGNFKGEPQPLGVYVYEVQAVTNAGTLFNKHGNVTLLR
ncbi:MAG: gliding motility-associated C-terminal domain-containing protein, partial [Taibaiella sp.]|nr:gliding motility-associated C-terminal domain-containing protein [Taibaiella sp.]